MHQTLSDPMRQYHISLFNSARLYEGHSGSGRRFADSEGIVAIVLVAFNKGFDVLGRYQQDFPALGLERSAPVVGATTGFHGHGHIRLISKKIQHLMALDGSVKHLLSCLVNPTDLKNTLCQINSD